MSASLAEAPQQQAPLSLFQLPGCHFDEVSLTIDPGMKFEHWERLVRSLERAEQGIQWYLGDALCYGEHEYGEKYAQVLDAHKKTGIPIDTLRNYQWVADKVKPVTRVTNLSWAVHREVAPLTEPEQRKILQKGAEEKAAGRKYTRRNAERDADRVKRESRPQAKDGDLILGKAARAFADLYMEELARLADRMTEDVPDGCPSLEIMIHAHGRQALGLKGRTRATDYAAIVKLFSFDEGTPGIERLKRDEISAWLETCGYYMSDSELNERLDLMVEKRMLEVKSVEDSRQEGRKGTMVDLYALHPDYESQLDSAA
jgi:hypothetical protein